jgi:phosphonate dehydrogenase
VLTPHLGSAVVDIRRDIERAAAESIVDVLAGRVPRNALNKPTAVRMAC